jgi:uncharacterized protein (DUF362 family)
LAAPHITTHPQVILAAAEVFRRMDAREVFVAEGPGHCRDIYHVLNQAALELPLHEAKLPFVDLNSDDLFAVKNRFRATSLRQFYLPQSLRRADLIVSIPKMKTHHWAGVTLSMKNLFGLLPGVVYGWPKNVFHHAGIPGSILDINAAVGAHLAIVDGIVGMEGDGPIMGSPKQMGVLVFGTNLPAVDATCARLMGFDPIQIDYLNQASGRFGPIKESHIEQRGEPLSSLIKRFELLDHPSMHRFRS